MYAKRVAGNEVVTHEGQCFNPGVVEIDKEGNVIEVYLLEGETAQTTWIGGRIEILKASDGSLRAYKEDKEIK